MSTLKFWQLIIRFSMLLGLAGLLALALQPDLPARAEVAARPMLQDDYPAEPTEDPNYPAPVTDTPVVGYPVDTPGVSPSTTLTPTATIPSSGTRQPTTTQQPFASPSALVDSPTPNLSQTAELDPFRTEDAEMGGSQNGTPTTPTPEGTPTASATPMPEDMNRISAIDPSDEGGGFEMNWGLFWIGFSIPVIGACGAVLYLLDRRPEYFRPKR